MMVPSTADAAQPEPRKAAEMKKKSERNVRSMRRSRVRTRSWTMKGIRSKRMSKSKMNIIEDESTQTVLTDIPLSYTHIECNEFIHRGHAQLVEDDVPVCSCKVIKGDPDSACGEHCLNFITSNECTPGFCPSKEFCNNQRFQQRKYIKYKLVKTEERGWGLLADEDVKMGEFIIEYCGEVISCEEAKIRTQAYEQAGLQDAYIISLSGSEFIDATKKGSLGRFINHSCEPNCETRKWTVLGEVRVGIFAKEFIKAGTELTYNYNFEWYGGAKVRCRCGAPSCVGFLGAKSRAFQEDLYVWDDNDDRFSVENVPLYDTDEDEPLSNFIKRAQVSTTLKNYGPKNIEDSSPFQTVLLESNGQPILDVINNSELSSVRKEEDNSANADLDTQQKESIPLVKEGFGVLDVVEKKLLKDKKRQVVRIKKRKLGASIDGKNSLVIEKSNVSHKRSRTYANHYTSKLIKSLKAQTICQYMSSEEAREELIASEKVEGTAALDLKRLHDEMRPTFEDLGKDAPDSIPILKAEEWITMTCTRLMAAFDYNYLVVKNLSCLGCRKQLPT